MLSGYLRFARANARFVGFGALMAFSSSFGQTYFIGIFGPSFQTSFDLGHTAWGGIYMAGTLASAFLLPWTGKLIDRVDLRRYTACVSLGLAAACLLTALAWNPAALVLAVLALRHTGQGLASHVAQTSMARYFDEGRGRAIAFCALGFCVAEAVLPVLAVVAIAALGWRFTYGAAAVLQAAVLVPALLWLLRGHEQRHAAYLERLGQRAGLHGAGGGGWTRAQVVRDPRFYLLLPGVFAPSLVVTALFFQHLNIADAKGWSHAWITGSYALYAAASVATSLLAGALIDRIGALRLVPLMLLPLLAALLVLALLDSAWAAWPYLALCGITSGITYTAVSAMWAELYGLAHLGAIRALAFAMNVFGSALGPVLFGAMLDAGVSVTGALLVLAVYVTLGALLLRFAARRGARSTVEGSA